MVWVNIEKIHAPIILDAHKASDGAVEVSDKHSSSAEALGPALHVGRVRSPGCDLLRRIVSRSDLAHRLTEAAHGRLEVIVMIRADRDASPGTERYGCLRPFSATDHA
jgi:hypothetical protein